MAEFVKRSQAETEKMVLCEDPETGENFYLPKNAIHFIFDDGTIVYNKDYWKEIELQKSLNRRIEND